MYACMHVGSGSLHEQAAPMAIQTKYLFCMSCVQLRIGRRTGGIAFVSVTWSAPYPVCRLSGERACRRAGFRWDRRKPYRLSWVPCVS